MALIMARTNIHCDFTIMITWQQFYCITGLCTIPEIEHGVIEDNVVGRVVPGGYKARVECFPAHRITGSETITCKDSRWTDIPKCILGEFLDLNN